VIGSNVEIENARPLRKSPWGPNAIQRAARVSEMSVMAAFRRRMSFGDGCDNEGEGGGEGTPSGGSLAIEVGSEAFSGGANTRSQLDF
jgi:hypothetical protein